MLSCHEKAQNIQKGPSAKFLQLFRKNKFDIFLTNIRLLEKIQDFKNLHPRLVPPPPPPLKKNVRCF